MQQNNILKATLLNLTVLSDFDVSYVNTVGKYLDYICIYTLTLSVCVKYNPNILVFEVDDYVQPCVDTLSIV